MSQERTRFPIQPEERRRSALSSRNVKAVPDEPVKGQRRARPGRQQDKPEVPPHERHGRGRRRVGDAEERDAGGSAASSGDGAGVESGSDQE